MSNGLDVKMKMKMKTVVVQSNIEDGIRKIKVDMNLLTSTEEFITYIHEWVKVTFSENLLESFHVEYLDDYGRFTENFPDMNCLSTKALQLLIVFGHKNIASTNLLRIAGKAFSISDGLKIGKKILFVNELNDNSIGTGHSIWDCSIVLAKYLDTHPDLVINRHVLELGSGTGVSGMAAAMLGASLTLCTDLIGVIPNLTRNIENNFPVDTSSRTIAAAALDWFDQATVPNPPASNGWQVVLAADVIWLEELVAPLVATFTAVCTANTLLLLSFQLRTERTANLFFDLMSRYFHLEPVSSTECHPDYQAPHITIYRGRRIMT